MGYHEIQILHAVWLNVTTGWTYSNKLKKRDFQNQITQKQFYKDLTLGISITMHQHNEYSVMWTAINCHHKSNMEKYYIALNDTLIQKLTAKMK